jgi:4-amino-4-deoxy-L-arabinose transferase-like glycosyltransferase
MDRLLTRRATLLVLALLTLWRLYLAATLQLHPDEAYYWLWSRALDAGYFDHAPLVAYFIAATAWVGQAELWVRLSGVLTPLLISAVLWQLGRQIYGRTDVAAAGVLLFNALPLSTLGLIVLTPDVPLMLCWALALVALWQLVRTQQARWWYALGAAGGLALLSKYTAVLLAPCVLLLLLATPERRWLRTPHPYLATLLALACFAPVLLWNSQHDWISLRFQFRHGLGEAQHSLAQIGTYLAGQALLVGPLTWGLGLVAAVAALRAPAAQRTGVLLLMLSAVPVIGFFAATSYRQLAGPNWPAYAYVGFSLLLAGWALEPPSRLRRLLWALAAGSSLLLSLLVTLHARWHIVPPAWLSPAALQADATNQFHGWRELAQALEQQTPRPDFVLVPSHQLAAEILYYSGQRLTVWPEPGARPSQFSLWPRPQGLQGRQGLYVWIDGEAAGPPAGLFAQTQPAQVLDVQRAGQPLRRYLVVAGTRAAAAPR